MRRRQIASVGLVVGLTFAGFFGARLLGEHDAQRDSEHLADVAAAQIRGRVEQGVSLAESLRRYMVAVGGSGATSEAFERNASRWLSPGGLPRRRLGGAGPAEERAATSGGSAARSSPATGSAGSPARGRGRPICPRRWCRASRRWACRGSTSAASPACLRRSPAGTLYDAGATPLTTLADGSRGCSWSRTRPACRRDRRPRLRRPVRLGAVAARRGDRHAEREADGRRRRAERRRAPRLHHGRAALRRRGPGRPSRARRRRCRGSSSPPASGWPRSPPRSACNAARARAGAGRGRPHLQPLARRDHRRRLRRQPAARQPGRREDPRLHPGGAARAPVPRPCPPRRPRGHRGGGFGTRRRPDHAVVREPLRRKDGTYRTLEWTATPVPDEERHVRRRARRDRACAARRRAGGAAAGGHARGARRALGEVFASVADELGRLLDARALAIERAEEDGTTTIVAGELPADDAVAVPIMVEGAVWGRVVAETERAGRAATAWRSSPRSREPRSPTPRAARS